METIDERYSQEKLTDLTPFRAVSVLDVGGGAVGSYLAELQAKMGVGQITVVDIDRYEKDNAAKTSSLIKLSETDDEADNGRWKAEALAERTEQAMIKGSRANGIVGSVENLGPMAFSSYDYVCAAPDNKAVREYVNQQLKMISPYQRPTYIVGGTDGEMGTSAVFGDLDASCYRCTCEEHSFKSSRRRTSCAEAQYRFTKEGKAEQIIVSNLSSVKAAVMMADDLRAGVAGKLFTKNRVRVWNPDNPSPMISYEPDKRASCPDCKTTTYPEETHLLSGCTLSTKLRDLFDQITTFLRTDDYVLMVHRHVFGEDLFVEFVRKDFCRSCGNMFSVYRHTRFVDSENDLLCDRCREAGKTADTNVVPSKADVLYGFTPKESDEKLCQSTMFDLGYPIGAYLNVICYNGADDRSDERVCNYCFVLEDDMRAVKENLNLWR